MESFLWVGSINNYQCVVQHQCCKKTNEGGPRFGGFNECYRKFFLKMGVACVWTKGFQSSRAPKIQAKKIQLHMYIVNGLSTLNVVYK